MNAITSDITNNAQVYTHAQHALRHVRSSGAQLQPLAQHIRQQPRQVLDVSQHQVVRERKLVQVPLEHWRAVLERHTLQLQHALV